MVCEQVASLDIPNNPRDAYKGLVQVLGLAWIQSSLMLFFCPFLHIVPGSGAGCPDSLSNAQPKSRPDLRPWLVSSGNLRSAGRYDPP